MAANAEIDSAVFDSGVLAAVQRLIPPDRLHGYLRDLDRQVVTVIDSANDDARLQSRAHMIVSQAGMLGLTRVSECARALEDACRSGAGPAAALVRLRAAAGDIRCFAMPAAGLPAR